MWGLGIVLYMLLHNGKHPFAAPSKKLRPTKQTSSMVIGSQLDFQDSHISK
jgi:hypothetical protein